MPPQLRPYALPAIDCAAHCAGLPTAAFLSCKASCEEGTIIPLEPVPLPPFLADIGERLSQALPSFGEVSGLVKWVVVGIAGLVVYQLVS